MLLTEVSHGVRYLHMCFWMFGPAAFYETVVEVASQRARQELPQLITGFVTK